jgi:hypothetical protein
MSDLLSKLSEQRKAIQSTSQDAGSLVQSFQIPIEFPYNGTKFRGYVTINATGIQNQDDLNAALKQIDDAFGIYIYQKQSNGFFNKQSYNNNWRR